MNRLLISALVLLAPLSAIAQQAAPAPIPEMPWASFLTFVIFSAAVLGWTVWKMTRKEEDDKK